MESFTLLTDTPVRLRDFLVAHGILTQDAQGNYIGTRPGMEIAKVPNPIQTNPVGPTYDDRPTFLVKFAHESQEEVLPGFRNWMQANTTEVAAPANYKINGVYVGNAWKVNGENVWLIKDDPDRFGVWQ